MSGDFILRRLHSILGMIPLYIFVPVHMVQKAIPYFTLQLGKPVWVLLIITGIAPFALHAALGLYIYAQNRSSPFNRTRGKLFRLQIISSFTIVIFVVLHKHLLNLLWHGAGHAVFVATFLLFMVGIAALAFHMGYGGYTFCVTWGICVKQQIRQWVRYITAIFGVILGVGGIALYICVFVILKGLLKL